jgi:hypothetical protein
MVGVGVDMGMLEEGGCTEGAVVVECLLLQEVGEVVAAAAVGHTHTINHINNQILPTYHPFREVMVMVLIITRTIHQEIFMGKVVEVTVAQEWEWGGVSVIHLLFHLHQHHFIEVVSDLTGWDLEEEDGEEEISGDSIPWITTLEHFQAEEIESVVGVDFRPIVFRSSL